MITYGGAIEYFNTHPRGQVWGQTSQPAANAALAHARRMLARALGRPMSDDETPYAEGDTTRDEYAVYEQALWLIINGVIANGEGSAPQPILAADGDDLETPAKRDDQIYAPEALRWLGYRGSVVVKG